MVDGLRYDIVRGKVSNIEAANNLIKEYSKYIDSTNEKGTLYLGYPLTASADMQVMIDALIITERLGLIAIIFGNSKLSLEKLQDEQDKLYFHLDFYFKKYSSLRKGRNLVFDPIVLTIFPHELDLLNKKTESYFFTSIDNIQVFLEKEREFDKESYNPICEVLQKVSTIRPRKQRLNIKKEDSFGAAIKEIEKEIANLDQWQKKAALEIPSGPQRIRGLAGTGKTIVLALKAAYLHSFYPNWTIGVTYYTRSLKQQYIKLISRFCDEFSGREPNWDKIKVMHSWGSYGEPGFYSELSYKINLEPYNYSAAKTKFGRNHEFRGICDELFMIYKTKTIELEYDIILIDEAQDLPSSFFKLLYKNLKEPKRIVWAYDELQNLSESNMPSISEMFDISENESLNINLDNKEDEPRRDIVLPVCYRNPPWTLTIAHALGFGIYLRDEKLPIQMFDDPPLWEEIGYSIVSGKLRRNANVKLKRSVSSFPDYFKRYLKEEESIGAHIFESKVEQYQWVAEEVYKNITNDELEPDDILIIFTDAISSKSEYSKLTQFLSRKGISSTLAGVTGDRDDFKLRGSVTCSGIYRAKGNEAPMVYVLNSDHCYKSRNEVQGRNILFTAITRSRAWVNICGVGVDMELLNEEIKKCKIRNYQLEFKIPSNKEMEQIARNLKDSSKDNEGINELSFDTKSKMEDILEKLKDGRISKDELRRLTFLLEKFEDEDK